MGAGGAGGAGQAQGGAGAADKLELARKLASRINIAKNLGAEAKVATQVTAEAIFKGGANMQPLITVSAFSSSCVVPMSSYLHLCCRQRLSQSS